MVGADAPGGAELLAGWMLKRRCTCGQARRVAVLASWQPEQPSAPWHPLHTAMVVTNGANSKPSTLPARCNKHPMCVCSFLVQSCCCPPWCARLVGELGCHARFVPGTPPEEWVGAVWHWMNNAAERTSTAIGVYLPPMSAQLSHFGQCLQTMTFFQVGARASGVTGWVTGRASESVGACVVSVPISSPIGPPIALMCTAAMPPAPPPLTRLAYAQVVVGTLPALLIPYWLDLRGRHAFLSRIDSADARSLRASISAAQMALVEQALLCLPLLLALWLALGHAAQAGWLWSQPLALWRYGLCHHDCSESWVYWIGCFYSCLGHHLALVA